MFLKKNNILCFEQEQCLDVEETRVFLLYKTNELILNRHICLAFEQGQRLVSEREQCLLVEPEQYQFLNRSNVFFAKNEQCLALNSNGVLLLNIDNEQ